MAGIPHTKSPDLIPKVLDLIQSHPMPAKVDAKFLQSAGLIGDDDDRNLVSLLKGLQLINQSGTPTPRWAAYRDKSKAPRELASDVRVGYADLFAAHPNAFQVSDEAIAKVVRNATKFNDAEVWHAVRTFRTLCERADFSKVPAGAKSPAPKKAPPVVKGIDTRATVPKATIKPNGSRDIADSELMEQARRCVQYGLFLPAHVMAWAAFMEFLFEKLSVDGLVALRALRPAWKMGEDIYEMAESVSEWEFVTTLMGLGFCTKNQQERFVALLRVRNDCAHPTTGYRPGLAVTNGYIEDLIDRARPLIAKSL